MDLLSECIVRGREKLPDMTAELALAIPIKIQNVADYCFSQIAAKDMWPLTDFPNLAPPWPNFFMEWTNRASEGVSQDFGVWGLGRKITDGEKTTGHDPFWQLQLYCFQRSEWIHRRGEPDDVRERLPRPVLTVLPVSFLVAADGSHPMPLAGTRLIRSDGEWVGSLRPSSHSEGLDREILYGWPEWQRVGTSRTAFHGRMLVPVFLAISLAHCKNVSIECERVPSRLMKKRLRNRGWSPDAWHNIMIEPMRKR